MIMANFTNWVIIQVMKPNATLKKITRARKKISAAILRGDRSLLGGNASGKLGTKDLEHLLDALSLGPVLANDIGLMLVFGIFDELIELLDG